MSIPLEITPQEIEQGAASGHKLRFIDVREPVEWNIARIEGAELVPMNTAPSALQQLEASADEATLIVYCHHGQRSLQVVHWLREQGLEACQSMTGGIDRWSREIDPNVPRY